MAAHNLDRTQKMFIFMNCCILFQKNNNWFFMQKSTPNILSGFFYLLFGKEKAGSPWLLH